MSSRISAIRRSALLATVTAVTAFALMNTTQPVLRQLSAERNSSLSEALYLPNDQAVGLLSFGYRRALSTFLWFRTINYFGKHYASDQRYQWLYHMCDLVTTLDPAARHVYDFGSNMLAWEAAAPQQAHQLLTKGMANNPTYWKFPYLRGFISLYFLSDQNSAKEDFITASQLPEVHPMVVGMAAKAVALQEDPEQAIAFLSNVLKTGEDPSVREVLLARMRELAYERDLRRFESALSRFREAKGTIPETIQELAPFLDAAVSLSDPFGGNYFIDRTKQGIASTSNHKRLGKKS